MGLGYEIPSEAAHLAARESGTHEHPVLVVLSLVDRRAEGIELGELAALVVGKEQPDGLEPLGEPPRDLPPELVQPEPRPRRDQDRVGKSIREPLPRQGVKRVDLVHDQQDGHLLGTDLAQHRLDRRDLLVE